MKITKKELVKTAKELNELMGLDPAIPTGKDVEEATLVEKIGEAAEMLEEDDEISEVAQEVIDYIAELQEEEVTPEADGQPADEDDAEETTEQLVEKSDYKALKAMVAWYPEFEGIDIALYPAKKVEDLRARMLKDLAKKAGKEAPVTEAKEEKPAAKKEAGEVSNKEQVHTAWKKGEKDVAKLHELIKERVQKSTITSWVKQWGKGQNLPACAKK
jgi:hypothetical protein